MGVKDARVYLDYDQEQLDDAYDQAVYAPNKSQIIRRHFALSEAALERVGQPLRLAYGPANTEFVDVFRTSQPRAPIFVFVHGGAWRAASQASYYAFLAEAFVATGVHFVLVEFSGVEEFAGQLLPVSEQVRRAVACVYRNAERFGGDQERIHLGGHSSGAHLVSTVLLADWAAEGLPEDLVKGAVCCGGMYDLFPVSLSKRSAYVQFDEATIDALSALRHVERVRAPVIIAYGSEESPEFHRQGSAFASALADADKPVHLLVAKGYNHFELIETLGNPHGLVGRAALAQMGLAR